jgi:hypothetical protein
MLLMLTLQESPTRSIYCSEHLLSIAEVLIAGGIVSFVPGPPPSIHINDNFENKKKKIQLYDNGHHGQHKQVT